MSQKQTKPRTAVLLAKELLGFLLAKVAGVQYFESTVHCCTMRRAMRNIFDHCLQAPENETQADAAAARVILLPRSMADMQVFLNLSAFTAALLPACGADLFR